jgi:hypothetical protein
MIYLFGDSHINSIFNPKIIHRQFTASSAMGLNKKNSVSKYHDKVIEELTKIHFRHNSRDKVFFKFGQVDTDFVYYIKLSNNHHLTFHDFAVDSVNKYFNFIYHWVDKNKLSVLSIYPPFVSDSLFRQSLYNLHFMDNHFKNDIQNKLNDITLPDIVERTKNNEFYNHLLKQKCQEYNIPFIDVFYPLLDDSTKITKYLNYHNDHHLFQEDGKKIVNNIINHYSH